MDLISDAVSFTDAGGVQILGIVSDGVGAARVDIIDTGIGFPESERARLFEPFERGPAPKGDTHGGRGSGSRSVADSQISSERRSWCTVGGDEGAGSA